MSREERCQGPSKTVPRMQRVEELFLAALDLPTAQRAAFLDQECRGDDELRRELDELLAAERGSSLGFPEPPRIKLLPTRKLQPKGFATTERAEPGHGGNAASEEESCGPVLRAGSCIGQYELIRQLGRGGMGEVYLARDLRLGRLVALKLLAEHRPSPVERFLAEARTTARCHHENIVVIYEVGERQGHPFMVLEYLEGQTLRQWLREHASAATGSDQRAAVPPGRAVELMLPVVRALAYAHERGIVHRDLKPENIMLTRAGTIKVLDFGIAKLLAAPAPDDESTAGSLGPAPMHSSALIGTLPYMSPEQMNIGAIDHRTDLWAVGIMLFELVTGQHPVPSRSMGDLMRIAEDDTPMPSVRERMPDIGLLGAVIDRCLIKPPAHRTPDARVLLAELEALAPARRSLAIAENGSPFAGLAAFQEADADCFFGRDREIEQIVTELRSRPLVAVVGASGVGKSSLVRAGVIPALKRSGEGWDACVVRPGRSPLAALAGVLAHLSDTARTTSDGAPEAAQPALVDSASHMILTPIIERLRTEPGYLGARLRARASSKLRRILVFVDQFEELYTLGVPADERSTFLACLAAVADDAVSPLRVILSMRSDFLDRLTGDRHLNAEVTRGLVLLPGMGREGLRAGLTRPLELREFRFESPALVERMIDALEATAGALPLLQFTATRLWELRDTGRRMLTEASYEQLGGVAGALASHADAVLASMPAQDARLARALFLRLVTPERTRALATMAELCQLSFDAEAMNRVLTRLVDARLLAVDGSSVGATGSEPDGVEIVHESLIDTWPLLGQWLVKSEEDATFLARLRSAAKDWQRSRQSPGLLWTGQAAHEVQTWHQRYQGELTPLEKQYLAAVIAAAERQRRLRRRFFGGAITATTLVALTMAYLAWEEGESNRKAIKAATEARQAAAHAERESMRTRDATRMAVAGTLSNDPTTQLALLREMEDVAAPPRGTSQELRRLLHADVTRVVLMGHEGGGPVAFSPDGSRIAFGSSDKVIRVWNADGSGPPLVLRGHERGIRWVAFSPDGAHIFSVGDDSARIWKANGTGAPRILHGDGNARAPVAFSPDGSRIVWSFADSTIRIWNVDGSGSPILLRGSKGLFTQSVAFSSDGNRIAIANPGNNLVYVWNTDGSGEPLLLGTGIMRMPTPAGFRSDGYDLIGREPKPWAVAFSPDGSHVAALRDDEVWIWNADGSGAPQVPCQHEKETLPVYYTRGDGDSLVFSPDGSRVVFTAGGKTVRTCDTDGSGTPRILRGHTERVRFLAFSPDGKNIASASDDGTVRIWDADGSDDSRVLGGPNHDIRSFALSPDGFRILSGHGDHKVRIWQSDGSGIPTVLDGHSSGRLSAFSPNGMHMASGHGMHMASGPTDNALHVWSSDSLSAPAILRDKDYRINSVNFSPDSSMVLAASEYVRAHIWKLDGSGAPLVLANYWAKFSDRSRLLSTEAATWMRAWQGNHLGTLIFQRRFSLTHGFWYSDDAFFVPDNPKGGLHLEGTLAKVWATDSVALPRSQDPRLALISPVFNTDASRIAFGSENTVLVWKVDGSEAPLVLRPKHDSAICSVAFSPDGSRIASGSWDRTIRIWNADGSGEPLVLLGHEAAVNSVAFSPDGSRIVSTSYDRTMRIWRVDGTGGPLVFQVRAQAAQFTPDGQRIMAISDGAVRVWEDLVLPDLSDPRLWAATTYCMTIELRTELLGVTEEMARRDHQRCLERVEQAGQAEMVGHDAE